MQEHHDETGARIGMWLFLLSEILLFGGLFILYSSYRYKHAFDFHLAAGELDRLLGTFNTLILLTSSLTMALSISSIQRGFRRSSLAYLIATIFLGLFFLGNKAVEWAAKMGHGDLSGFPHPCRQGKQRSPLFRSLLYHDGTSWTPCRGWDPAALSDGLFHS